MSVPAYAEPIGWVHPESYAGLEVLSERWRIVLDELSRVIAAGAPWLHFTDDDSVAKLETRTQEEIEALIRQRMVALTAPVPHKLFPLMRERQTFAETSQLCPETVNMVKSLPPVFNAAFAALEAGGEIAPHQGSSDRVDRCHLGLIIPEGDVRLRVAGVARGWTPGHLMIFDDRSFHEAWNHTPSRRFVLIVDLEKEGAVNRRQLLEEQP